MKRRKTISWSKVSLWVCIFLFGLYSFQKEYIQREYQIYQIKKDIVATEERIADLKKQQAELQAEQKRLSDARYIEKLAREEYNMVGKNEVPLFIVDEKK